jgi:hypothetical protein
MRLILSLILCLLFSPAYALDAPTTPIIDDFNRSNEGPPPGEKWYTIWEGWKVVSNQCVPNATETWNGIGTVTNFTSADCEAYFTIVNKSPTVGDYIEIELRMDRGLENGYGLVVKTSAGDDVWQMNRWDLEEGTQLGVNATQEITAGDKVLFRVVGSTLIGGYNNGTGWIEIINRTDATYSAAGETDLWSYNNSYQIDDFGGGNYTAPASPVSSGSQIIIVE